MFGFKRRDRKEKATAGQARRRRWYTRKSRYAIWGGLFLFVGVLIAYNIVTEDGRVRRFVQGQLSSLTGANVQIEHASFSLLGGLQVEGVNIYTDDVASPESRLFSADKLKVVLDPAPLVRLKRPRLERLEAEGVDLALREDADSGTWNFETLLKKQLARQAESQREPLPPSGGAGDSVPAVFLRNASVSYSRTQEGKSSDAGKIEIDALVYAMSPGRYGFDFVAQPPGTTRRTAVFGVFDARAQRVDGRITELRFDDALRRMMPTQVRGWMERLDLAGQFSVPRFSYSFGPSRDTFDITVALADVQSTVQPLQWLNERERYRRNVLRQAVSLFDHLHMDQRLPPKALAAGADDDASPLDLLEYLRLRTRLIPLSLKQLRGAVRFTNDAVELNGIHFQLQGQSFVMDGRMNGYSGSAPGELRVQTEPGTYFRVPPHRQFMNWLPDDVHRVYLQFRPEGKAMLDIQLVRPSAGAAFEPTVIAELFDSQFAFEDFPYPLQRCTGKIVFARDEATGEDLVKLVQIRGYGIPDGPNARRTVEVNGTVGPFISGGAGVDIHVSGTGITSEPAIRRAFPREVAKAMLIFGPPDYGARQAAAGGLPRLSDAEILHWPEFFGDFTAHIHRDAGPRKPVDTDVQFTLGKAAGSLKVFPYPMHDLTCKVRIQNDFLQIQDLRLRQNGAALNLNGTVQFGDPANPDLNIEALNVPIDDGLLNALPPTERSWIRRASLEGRVDIIGRVFLNPPTPEQESEVNFGLALRLHDAKLLRDANGPATTGLNGDLFLKPARLDIKSVAGRRGDASLQISGNMDWQDGTPDVQLNLGARNLLLDRLLHDILPKPVQESWDQQRPEGTTDLDLEYSLQTPPEGANPTTADNGEHIKLSLRPRKLSVMSESFRYRLDDLQGEVLVDGPSVQFRDLTGRHGAAQVKITGSGKTAPASDFELKVQARDLAPDAELLAAVPSALADVLSGLQAGGTYAVDFQKLHVRDSSVAAPARASAPAASSTSQPATRPVDVDFDCAISTASGAINIGAPVTSLNGSAHLAGEVRQSELTRLDGTVSAESYQLLDRQGARLSATLRRPPFVQALLIESLRSELAGGSLAGGVTIQTPGDAPSRYAVDLTIRNADVMQVAGDSLHQPVQAQLSADLSAEGVFGDSRNRRGRGEISIDGEGMYEAPVILGLFRLVNFSLPVRQGVRHVRLSYVLNNDAVTFDNVEMTAPGLRIYGEGKLDFGSRKLGFTLNTENPDALSIPLFEQLVRKMREELLQIRVAGTIQEPEVKATSFPTFQATLNQVIEDVKQQQKKR